MHLHHVVYRCRDAARTAEFYKNVMGLPLAAALSQSWVPTLQRHIPHNHLFFRMSDGSYMAFFDILGDEDPVRVMEDEWAQHIALEVTEPEAKEIVARLDAQGIPYVGPEAHGGLITSWYFRDPDGHKLEITIRTGRDDLWERLAESAENDLADWMSRKASGADPASFVVERH